MATERKMIARLAAQLKDPSRPHAPEDCAREMGWIDGNGRLTKDGAALAKAMDDQEATRSVFRLC